MNPALIPFFIALLIIVFAIFSRAQKSGAVDNLVSSLGEVVEKKGWMYWTVIVNGQKVYVRYHPQTRSRRRGHVAEYVSVSIDAPAMGRFKIHKRAITDKIIENAGLSGAFKTGDSVFDADHVIRSYDDSYCQTIFSSPVIKQAVSQIFFNGVTSLKTGPQCLKVKWKQSPNQLTREMIVNVVRNLILLAQNLPTDYVSTGADAPARKTSGCGCAAVFFILFIGAAAWFIAQDGGFGDVKMPQIGMGVIVVPIIIMLVAGAIYLFKSDSSESKK